MAASQRVASAAETTAATSCCNVEAVAGVILSPRAPQPCSSQPARTKASTAASSLQFMAGPRFAGVADPEGADRVRGTWSARKEPHQDGHHHDSRKHPGRGQPGRAASTLAGAALLVTAALALPRQ